MAYYWLVALRLDSKSHDRLLKVLLVVKGNS